MTLLLLVLNIGCFLLELALAADLDAFLRRWGLVPADVLATVNGASSPAVLVTLLSSTLLHAGWLHLLVNLTYLAVFGGAVEQRLGSARFLLLYVSSGLIGNLVYLVAQPQSETPAIGASGAIAGLIAAHLLLYPDSTLGSLAPVLFFRRAENMPALVLLLLWVVAQLFSGVASITTSTGIAWWAHIGGFGGGLVMAPLLRRRQWRGR